LAGNPDELLFRPRRRVAALQPAGTDILPVSHLLNPSNLARTVDESLFCHLNVAEHHYTNLKLIPVTRMPLRITPHG
jgi:hypothetical protein